MLDAQRSKAIRVHTEWPPRPYIMVPVDQLQHVRTLLDREEISYWVETWAISFDDKPAVAFLNLGLPGDAARVQAILDEAR